MAARPKKAKEGSNSEGDIATFVAAIEEIDRQKDELGEERKMVFIQAVAEGIDKSTLQKVVMRRRKIRADIIKQDRLIAEYERRLGLDALS